MLLFIWLMRMYLLAGGNQKNTTGLEFNKRVLVVNRPEETSGLPHNLGDEGGILIREGGSPRVRNQSRVYSRKKARAKWGAQRPNSLVRCHRDVHARTRWAVKGRARPRVYMIPIWVEETVSVARGDKNE